MNVGKPNFIVIDDNKVDCFIAEKIVENSGKSAGSLVFYQATQALDHIKNRPVQAITTIIFVDIQMPVMNGFEFMEAFEHLPAENQRGVHIYVLSSSINERDIARAKSFASVKRFLNKPLTTNIIDDILKDHSY